MLDQWDLPSVESLRPLVAPSLRSGHYSLVAFRILQTVDPSVSVSNYYLELWGLFTMHAKNACPVSEGTIYM